MHEKTRCLRCSRKIDAYAKLCPFCNYDQQAGAPVVPPPRIGEDGNVIETPMTPPPIIPQKSGFQGKRVLIVLAVVLLLASTFAVGALVNVIGSRSRLTKQAAAQDAEKAAQEAPQATQSRPADSLGDLRLVPVDPQAPVGEAITSIPLKDPDANIPQELQRSDATALPSEQYARILEEARPQRVPAGAVVDPRTLPGGIEEIRRAEQARLQKEQRDRQVAAAAARAAETESSEPETEGSGASTTNPVPTHQPLPDIDRTKIKQDGRMRFDLRVGADGRVKEVRIIEAMPGLTSQTVSAVQQWRFKPATRNGEPVEGNFQVDISYNAPR